MNQLLEEKFEKPDAAFEQRMLANFRERVPEKNMFQLISNLMRLRSAQIAGVAAVLLALLQIGRMVTNERGPNSFAESREIVTGSNINIPTAEEVGPNDLLRRPQAFAAQNEPSFSESLKPPLPAPSPMKPAEFKEEVAGGFAGDKAKGEVEERGQLVRKEKDTISQFGNDKIAAASAKKSTDRPAMPAAPPVGPNAADEITPKVVDQRKLIRNAKVDLEILSFEDVVAKITQFAGEARGYVATSGSQKQANGKLHGEVVAKVLPQNLDSFLQKVRALGDLKNQMLGSEDVTKAYFDTEARLNNARVMEQRLVDMMKTKTGKVSDLLEVERELGRVRENIEKMQGELKYWDSQVQFATVIISLAEKDLEEPAAFLLKEHDQVSLFAADVEKIYNDIKALASSKVQITTAQLDRGNSDRVSARLSILVAPEESDALVGKVKSFGRVGSFDSQTQRIAQDGNGLSENAETKRDKVELNVTISRETDEQPIQETSLRIRTSNVDENAAHLKDTAAKSGIEVRDSTFSRDSNGREVANISLRTPMKNYAALMKSLNQLGEVQDVTVQRRDRAGRNSSEETAPADISIQIYSQGNIVSSDTGLIATVRHTLGQSAGAIMWSVRMIGVAVAFLAPWAIALVALIWIVRRLVKKHRSDN